MRRGGGGFAPSRHGEAAHTPEAQLSRARATRARNSLRRRPPSKRPRPRTSGCRKRASPGQGSSRRWWIPLTPGAQLRAALEMNVFNPETPLRDMEVDDIDALKERYLNTKFLLNQSRNPFPASLLQELPTLAAQHREVERVIREQGRGLPPTQVPLALRSRPLKQSWACRLAR